ncbi:MAG: ATP-binding protein [Saprospiraceae bacterium]
MRSPFKFLDAYVLKDKEYFFGREEEVVSLYHMVTKNRLILVYGKSGTGKTSLAQCGLAGRFDKTDWYPLFVKRGENINRSITLVIEEAAQIGPLDHLADGIMEIYANQLRPVYLIIDQLEELFILGTEKERTTFIYNIKTILEAQLPCRVIFILREEYLAQLYEFEKVIPSLLDRRLRVEQMSITKLKEVITKSCTRFNISLEEPEKNTQQIIDRLNAGRVGIHLPYLQVYLDMLWQEDYQRTYGNGDDQVKGQLNGHTNSYPALTFDTKEIENFGAIEDVLQRFLHQQEKEIQSQLSKKNSKIPPEAVRTILDGFVTAEGTKRPIQFSGTAKEISIPEDFAQQWKPIGNQLLGIILKALEDRRLLRSEDRLYELAHDSLAAIIDQERTDEERQLAEIKRRLENSYHEYLISGAYLTPKQIDQYEDFIYKLPIAPEVISFFKESQAMAIKKKKQARRRRHFIYLGLFLFSVMMAIAAFISNNFRMQAEEERTNAQNTLQALQEAQEKEKQLRIESFIEKGRSQMALSEYLLASNQFELVLTFDSTHRLADSLRKVAIEKAAVKNEYEALLQSGQQALELGQLIVAMNQFNKAIALPLESDFLRDARIGIIETKSRMLPAFRKTVEAAVIFEKAGACDNALGDIKRAKELLRFLNRNDLQDELKKLTEVEKECPTSNSG